MGNQLVLDVGCGKHKVEGAIGLDRTLLAGVDVVADIESILPFCDNCFSLLYANHVLEHVTNLAHVLSEFERVCCPGAVINIVVPYFSCVGAFGDPTHVRFFTYYTFDFFSDNSARDPERYTWFSSTRFHIRRRRIGFGRLFRMLGIEWWANHFPYIYEGFLPYILPARTLIVELIVVKSDATQR